MTDERSPDMTQALLLELRAQLEEARRERDEQAAALCDALAREDFTQRERDVLAAAASAHVDELRGLWKEQRERADGLEEQLADARLSAEQAAKERDEERARADSLLADVDVAQAALIDALDREAHLRNALKEAGEEAAQVFMVEKALAAEKAELVSRVGVLSDLLRRYRDHHDDLTHEATGGGDAGCFCTLCDEAHEILEVES